MLAVVRKMMVIMMSMWYSKQKRNDKKKKRNEITQEIERNKTVFLAKFGQHGNSDFQYKLRYDITNIECALFLLFILIHFISSLLFCSISSTICLLFSTEVKRRNRISYKAVDIFQIVLVVEELEAESHKWQDSETLKAFVLLLFVFSSRDFFFFVLLFLIVI